MASNVLVFIEQRNGRILPASFQLVAVGHALVERTGGAVEACVVGQGVAALADVIASYGAQKLYTVDDAALAMYRSTTYTAALAAVIERAEPGVVLIPTTFMGRDLAARVAARMHAALAVDCTAVGMDGEALVATKTMYAGKKVAKFRLAPDRLRVVTIRSNAYGAREPRAGARAEVVAVPVPLSDADQRLVIREVAAGGSGVKDVTEGDIVVSGGRSLKSEENFKIIYELAEALDGAVGASRAACDAGYQPHTRQVGLTGKVVTPKLYIACGIDGAIQHLAGMRGSKVIVAINTKKDAPIYKVATYGCVCDLFTLVPLLTKEFHRLRG
jgi:electron transfer flavoprotein alpha subunit